MDFKSGAELLEQCAVRGMTISEVMKQRECDLTGVSMEDIEARMKDVLAVMRDSATLPLREPVTSIGGLIGGESARMEERRRKGTSILSGVLGRAVIYAMAVLEVNTSMGLIVAAPTAGSSGIVPGLLLALQEEYGLEDDWWRTACLQPLLSDTWPCATPPCQGRWGDARQRWAWPAPWRLLPQWSLWEELLPRAWTLRPLP